MYNKIFTKILDSSIWLEPDPTRIVWITMIAAMDEDGMCHFASIENLARRAVVDIEKAKEAVRTLESPDANSCDPDHDGRRIERVPGGWMVLNAQKYKELVTRVVAREQTRQRVARYRQKHAQCNAPVTVCNDLVTPSETVSVSISDDRRPERLAVTAAPSAKPAGKSSKSAMPDSDWLETLKTNPAYAGIDIQREFGKAQAWCDTMRRVLNRRRFVNWLNRCERPMNAFTPHKPFKVDLPEPQGWRAWLAKQYPDNLVTRDGGPWSSVDKAIQAEARRALT
jgi:hypothetical protein